LFHLACKVHGGSSLLVASILESRARIEFELLQLVRHKSCAPLGEFKSWVENLATKTVDNIQKSIDVLISLRARVPEDELVFATSFTLSNSEEDTKSEQIKNGHIYLDSNLFSHLARCYSFLGEYEAYIAIMMKENVYINTSEVDPSASVVDRYLLETTPEDPLVASNFSSPHISAAIHAMNTSLSFHSENSTAAQRQEVMSTRSI